MVSVGDVGRFPLPAPTGHILPSSMTDAQTTASVSLRRPLGSWPLIAAVACISAGLVVGPLLISPAPDSTVVAVSGLVALLLLGLGVLALIQTFGISGMSLA